MHVVEYIISPFLFIAEQYFIELLYFIWFILQLKGIWVLTSLGEVYMIKYLFFMANQCHFWFFDAINWE